MQLFTPAMRADPYPFYRWLRETHPVYFDAAHGFWLLSRYDDVFDAFHDPRLHSERSDSLAKLKEAGDEDLAFVYQAVADMTLFCDPPKHTRLRSLMQKAFTPKSLEAMHGMIAALVDELLAPLEKTGRIDLINDFAVKLPMLVISAMLGVPREQRAQFTQWVDDFNTFTGKVNTDAEENDRTARSMKAMFVYFKRRIDELRAKPEANLLSELVQAEQQGDRLSEAELLANCALLLAAGYETTAHLIGNGMHALMQHRDQYERLVNAPALATPAVEELLRYDTSVQFTGRMAGEDITLHGERIRAGEFVMLLAGSANRDPAHFADPDALDLTRKDNKHIGFGHGIHFCLGAPLARIEARIAFAQLTQRLPKLRLATNANELEWRDNFSVRGLVSLPLEFDGDESFVIGNL
jgi:cytochrome P450